MSDYEQHSGKIRQILPLEGESFEQLLFREVKEITGEDYTDIYYVEDTLYHEGYLVSKDSLWKVEENVREDECDSYCRLTPNPDGSFSFHTRFYNGGTCLIEMIEDELKKLNNSYI